MKKYFSLILIFVILFNFIILDVLEKNRVYAEFVITSALSLKLFASILAGMGVYLATTQDYVNLYSRFQQSHYGQMLHYTNIVKNLIIHRIVADVKGRYEFIRDFINSLDFATGSYQTINVDSKPVPIDAKGNVSDGYTVKVSHGYVFAAGFTVFKILSAPEGGYRIYTRPGEPGYGYNLLGGMLGDTIIFRKSWEYDGSIMYDVNFIDYDGNEGYSGGGIVVDDRYLYPDDTVDTEPTDGDLVIRIKKNTSTVDLPTTKIGVLVDYITDIGYSSVENAIENVDNMEYFDSDYIEYLESNYDISMTQVICPSITIENVPVSELETYPPIPGELNPPVDIPGVDVPGNPDVPIDPSIPIDPSFPIDDSIPIPDESVLDEPIADDSNVIGLGLITRLLRFIGNILKLAIVTPINIIKSGIIALYEVISSIPSYLSNIIDYIKDIPSKLTEIVTGVLAIPTWLGNILDKVSSIPTFLEGVYTGIIDGIVAISETITGTYESFKDWAIGIPDSLVQRWENAIEKKEELRVKWFEPTKSIDLSPLQVVTIKEKFPFSLPFDIMNIFNQLNSSPEIPSWEVNILSASFTIDFTQFEQLAVIVRWAIVIIFVISLIKFYSTLFL